MYVTPNSPLIVTVAGATPVRCSLICRTVEMEGAKTIVMGFELPLELMAPIPFVRGELIKPILHCAIGAIYAKTTLNYLGNAPSR